MFRKIFKTGHSLAVTLPKKILDELGLKPGDKVVLEFDERRKEAVLKKAHTHAQLEMNLKIRHRLGERITKQ